MVVDHLIEALGNDPSSSIRRAMILCDIDQNPGTSQVRIMDRLGLHKSALNREIEWLFNYGCVMIRDSELDARIHEHFVCGYSKKGLEAALDYFGGSHDHLKFYLNGLVQVLRQEKPTLRDARIFVSLYEKGEASKQDVLSAMQNGSASSDNRAYNKLVETGVIREVSDAA